MATYTISHDDYGVIGKFQAASAVEAARMALIQWAEADKREFDDQTLIEHGPNWGEAFHTSTGANNGGKSFDHCLRVSENGEPVAVIQFGEA